MKLDNFINKPLPIDYNPLNDLILIEENQEILIISINTLQILCVQPVKYVKNALFLQNDIITLQKKGELKVWEICNQDEQYCLSEKYYQNFADHDFEKMLKFEINKNQRFLILFLDNDILILDCSLQLIEKVKIISSDIPKYNEKFPQVSKRKVSYFDFYKQTIHILPIFNPNT